MPKQKIISKTVWLISWVSLFTDIASEMLYPVMPVYLKSVGYSVLFIGVLEGIVEAVAGLSKSYFGRWSDASGKRLPFVRVGYLLSSVSKPLLAVSAFWGVIFGSRMIDRLGKGMRTAPRDAMLNAEATATNKGTIFGFHRMMDTFGAVTGPLIALLFLYFFPGDYIHLFILAFIPGVIAVLFTFFIKEKKAVVEKKTAPPFHQTFTYWKSANPAFKKIVTVLLVFALLNSSDVFLLLKMKEAGISDVTVISVYVFYNLVLALFAFPLGKLSDKIGMKTVFAAGLTLYAITYIGFAFSNHFFLFVLFFFTYGLYAASTEGISKAWISKVVPASENASAIGFYTGFQSIAAFIASSAAGVIWVTGSSVAVFIVAGGVALMLALWLWLNSFDNN
jgi:MFS family permease